MAVTDKQGTKPKTKAQKADAERVYRENTDSVNKSVDEWRASQGMPPIDRSRKE